MLRLLIDDPYTADELIAETGLGITTVRDYIRQMRKQKLIYLVNKLPDRKGQRSVEQWRWGPDQRDTYRKTTGAQRARNYRERRDMKALCTGIAGTMSRTETINQG